MTLFWLAAALALGASGVQMGTRFVVTRECQVHPNFKRAIIEAQDNGTVPVLLSQPQQTDGDQYGGKPNSDQPGQVEQVDAQVGGRLKRD